MEWSERMNLAIDYVETHLDKDVDLNEAARRACCSSFHFHRTFSVVLGVPFAEYVRRRRLSLAAMDLSLKQMRVIDVAMKYGYESPDAFSRAFRNMHGITPAAAREPDAKLTAYPRISFQIILKGGVEMDYRITEQPGFTVVGKGKQLSFNQLEELVEVQKFWKELVPSNDYRTLINVKVHRHGTGITGGGLLSVSIPADGEDEVTYVIGVEELSDVDSSGLEAFAVPASTWAVFEVTGPIPDSASVMMKRIFEEWFPSSGYEYAGTPFLEAYSEADTSSPDYSCQIWMPIRKRQA